MKSALYTAVCSDSCAMAVFTSTSIHKPIPVTSTKASIWRQARTAMKNLLIRKMCSGAPTHLNDCSLYICGLSVIKTMLISPRKGRTYFEDRQGNIHKDEQCCGVENKISNLVSTSLCPECGEYVQRAWCPWVCKELSKVPTEVRSAPEGIHRPPSGKSARHEHGECMRY